MFFRYLLAAVVLLAAATGAAAADVRAYDSAQLEPRDQAKAKLLPLAKAGDPLAQWHLAGPLDKEAIRKIGLNQESSLR